MGRFIAVLLFVALLIPAGLVGRTWSRAALRRQVSYGALSLVLPTTEAEKAMKRQGQRARRWRLAGLGVAVVLAVVALIMYAERAVFLWPALLVGGLLAGVLLGELTRIGPSWATQPTARRRQGEIIDVGLVAIGRVTVLALIAFGWLAMSLAWAMEARIAAAVGVGGWLLVEITLERLVRRDTPSDSEDIPVDDALRINSAHVAVGAGSILALVVLAALLLVGGVSAGETATGADLRPVALIAAAFGSLVAGLIVTAFLFKWLMPVRWIEAAWGTSQRG